MKKWLGALLLAGCAATQTVPRTGGVDVQKGRLPAGRRGAAAPGASNAGRGSAAAAAKPAAATAGTSPEELKYAPLRPIREDAITQFRLSNGLRVYLMEDHDLPMVAGVAMVKTGSLMDPPQRIGLAQIAGTALRTGGSNIKTPEQIDLLIADNAATVDSTMADSIGTVSFNALKENAGATMQLFKELLAQPGFRQEKVDLAKAQLREAVARRNDAPQALARREFAALIYGRDNAYGWQADYTTLAHVKRADVRAFHQRYYFPANTMLGIFGDFNSGEMRAQLEKLFGDWMALQPPAPEFGKVKNEPAPGVFLAEKKDAQQSYFTLGHLGGMRSDKDYAALQVMAGVLGGGPEARIGSRLRKRMGIGNEVKATWDAGYLQPGVFEISGSTKSVSTARTIKAIQDEIGRLRTSEVSEDECRVARDGALNDLIFSHDTPHKLFVRQMLLEYYGYPKDFLSKYEKALQAVTRADVERVAKEYLKPADMTIVVAANPVMFGEGLETLGTVTKLDITIPEAKAEVTETSDASMAQGKAILAQAQAAVGGADKLENVKDYTMLAEYQIDPAVNNIGGAKVVQTDRWIKPTIFRQDSTLPAGRVSAYTDGKIGWISTPQGWGALTGVQRSQVTGDLFRVYFRLLLSDRVEGRTVNAIEENTVQVTDSTGQLSTVEFDAKTHLPVRVSYDTQQAGGAPIYSEDVYDDFRDVGGILIPFKLTINQGGRRFADMVVKDYKINTGLSPQEMGRRPQ